MERKKQANCCPIDISNDAVDDDGDKDHGKSDEDDDGEDDKDNDSPVKVSVDDGLGEVVQVLHALGHVNGYDELGLQINDPVHLNIVTDSLQSHWSLSPFQHTSQRINANQDGKVSESNGLSL